MTRIEEIKAEIEKTSKLLTKAINSGTDFKSYDDFEIAIAPFQAKISKLDREMRMIMPYELSELPNYGNVMSLAEFIDNVKTGGFIDYDGWGSYVKDGKRTNIDIHPSDIKYKAIRNEFDTIIWFNR